MTGTERGAYGEVPADWLRAWPSGYVHAFDRSTHSRRALCGADPAEDTEVYPSHAKACHECWRRSGMSFAYERPWLRPDANSDYPASGGADG